MFSRTVLTLCLHAGFAYVDGHRHDLVHSSMYEGLQPTRAVLRRSSCPARPSRVGPHFPATGGRKKERKILCVSIKQVDVFHQEVTMLLCSLGVWTVLA